MVCPLSISFSRVGRYEKLIAGRSLAFASRISIGDCSLPTPHVLYADSSAPQCAGPPSPSYAQWECGACCAATADARVTVASATPMTAMVRSEEHTSELQSRSDL